MQKLLLLALYTILTCTMLGQQRGQLSRSGDWDESLVPVANEAQSGDYYKFDSLTIEMVDLQPEFAYFVVKRHFLRKFSSKEEFNLTLPESFDPLVDSQTPQDFQNIVAPYFSAQVHAMSARSFSQEGAIGWKDQNFTRKKEKRLLRDFRYEAVDTGFDFRDLPQYLQTFQFGEVNEGDWLEVKYEVHFPYDESDYRFNSFRIFLDGDIPKDEAFLELKYQNGMICSFFGEEPDVEIIEPTRITHRWTRTDLLGGLKETCSDPSSYLSYAGILLNSYNERNRIYYPGQIIEQVDYWQPIMRNRLNDYFWFQRLGRKRIVVSRQDEAMKNRAEHYGFKTNKVMAARRFHKDVVDRFSFEYDSAYYALKDHKLEYLAFQIKDGRLRESSRLRLYMRMLHRLQVNFDVAFVSDPRSAPISEDFYTSLTHNDFYFIVRGGEEDYWLHPKFGEFGYYENEFPFYLEGAKAAVAKMNLMISLQEYNLELENIPYTDPKNNFRTFLGAISLDSEGQPIVNGVLTLNGLFSTSTRFAYKIGAIDPKISSLYGKRLDKGDGKIQRTEAECTKQLASFPYQSQWELSFEMEAKENTIEVGELINPVLPIFNDLDHRVLPLALDFECNDSFEYDLSGLLQAGILITETEMKLDNTVGSISLNITDRDEEFTTLKVNIELKDSSVGKHQFDEYQALLDFLESIKKYTIPLNNQRP